MMLTHLGYESHVQIKQCIVLLAKHYINHHLSHNRGCEKMAYATAM